MEVFERPVPIDKEVSWDKTKTIMSKTDRFGTIEYANEVFVDVCGYEDYELMGQPHNIIRHPDMPKAAFADLWQNLQHNRSWRGMVKNRCKDGRYYWVDAFVTPIYQQGKLVGYQSVRVKPDAAMVERANKSYPAIAAGKIPSDWRSRFGLKRLLAATFSLLLAAIGVAVFGWHFLL